jgi:hypothetical protein
MGNKNNERDQVVGEGWGDKSKYEQITQQRMEKCGAKGTGGGFLYCGSGTKKASLRQKFAKNV